MKKNILLLVIVLILVFISNDFDIEKSVISFADIFGGNVAAQGLPSINSVSGNIINGGSATVTGLGFGIKSPAAPILWENFEWGFDGDFISTSPEHTYTYSLNNGCPEIDTSQKYGQGTRSAFDELWESGDESTEFRPFYYTFNPSTKIYLSYYGRWGHSAGTPSIYGFWKTARLVGEGGVYSTPPSSGTTYFPSNGDHVYYFENGDGLQYGWKYDIGDMPKDVWHRLENYFVASTPGSADGLAQFWHNLVKQNLKANWDTGVMTRNAATTGGIFRFNSGHMWVNAELNKHFYIWVDDLYIDNTQARVEIGNNAVWENCTKREIQIPTAWSDGSITFTANQGSFQAGNTVYLYIVDQNGEINISGYPVVIGGSTPIPPSSDTTSPSAPTNLSATAISSSQINLSWTASTDPSTGSGQASGVTGYKIYRNDSYLTSVSNTSYADTNLSPLTTYSYTVSAYDAADNESGQSTSASATTYRKGDINKDDEVNSADFIRLIAKWWQTSDIADEDLNSDGLVNARDLGILMREWDDD